MGKTKWAPQPTFRFGRGKIIPVLSSLLAIVIASALLPAVAAPRKADLIVTAVSNPPASKAQDQTFKITDTTKNKGNKKAGKSKTAYYLSTDKKKSASDVKLTGTRSVKALGPGKKSTGSKTVTIPVSTPVATYFVLACADDKKAVAESSERNNCRSSTGDIDVTLKDTTAPVAPTITDTNPDSPSSDPSPNVIGTAEPASTIKVYGTSDCTGPALATEAATQGGEFDIVVSVSANAQTQLSATATDAGNNTSPCSNSVQYTHDSVAPADVSNLTTTPVSPANDNTVLVKGTAEPGSTVRLYDSLFNCEQRVNTGPTGTAEILADPGIEMTVADNSTTSIWIRVTDAAGNEGACGGGVDYVEDSTAPSPPSLTGSDPASPSNVNTPKLQGTAEAASFIKIYTTSDCTGSEVASGGESALSGPGIPVNVPANSTTEFRATATDASGNVSGCSSALTYVEDSIAPAAPTGLATVPATSSSSRANDNNPEVTGLAEAGSTVRLHTVGAVSLGCTNLVATGTAAQLGSGGITIPVGENSTSLIRATATDAAGNTSGCSGGPTYLEGSPQTELEPNDSTLQANRFHGITGGIQGVADAGGPDLYQVTVPAGGFIRAETKDQGFGDCLSPGTMLTLLAPNGNAMVADDDGGVGECSLIDGTPAGGTHSAARNLAGGTYYLKVEKEAGAGPVAYELRKHVGLTSATAEVEPNGTVADAHARATANPSLLITGNKTIEGSITPLGDRDFFKMDLSSPQVVHLETFDATGVDCPSAGTNLLLFDSNGIQIAGMDTLHIKTAGIRNCSAVTREFPAGVTFVAVEDDVNDQTITTYRLESTFLTDLGNETEPNDTIATATVASGNNFVISGDHENHSDVDVFKISAPSGSSVRAEIIEGNGNLVETCEPSTGVDSRLTLTPATGPFLAEDDDDGRGVCSLIDGTGPPPVASVAPLDYGASVVGGDLYLTVRGFNGNNTPANVFDYRLTVIMK